MSSSGIRGYRDLIIWQRAMSIAEQTYVLTGSFPKDEIFGLTSQARRAAVSIPANIAEGYGRGSRPSYANFVRIAQGSLKELETHLLLAQRVGYLSEDAMEAVLGDADELGRMMRVLLNKLATSPKP